MSEAGGGRGADEGRRGDTARGSRTRLVTAGPTFVVALLLAGCPKDTPPAPPVAPAPPPRVAPAAPEPAQEDEGFPPVPPIQREQIGDPGEEPAEGEEPLWDGGPVEPVAPPPPEPQQPDPPIAREPVRDGAIARFPGIRIYVDERRIEVDGLVCMKRGPALELMGCTRRGKTHESLVLFECEPEQLYLSLILLGLEPTPQIDKFGQAMALERGERVVLEVEWAEKDSPAEDPSLPAAQGGRVRRRVEDLIFDRARKGPMPRVGWVFTGSRHVDVPAPPDWKETMKVFAATYAGNVAATYHDPDAILDTPLIEGGDDTAYLPYSERVPERGVEVVIHLRPWQENDGPALPGWKPRGGAAPIDSTTPPGSSAPIESTTPAPGGETGAPGAPGGER